MQCHWWNNLWEGGGVACEPLSFQIFTVHVLSTSTPQPSLHLCMIASARVWCRYYTHGTYLSTHLTTKTSPCTIHLNRVIIILLQQDSDKDRSTTSEQDTTNQTYWPLLLGSPMRWKLSSPMHAVVVLKWLSAEFPHFSLHHLLMWAVHGGMRKMSVFLNLGFHCNALIGLTLKFLHRHM